MSKKPKPEQCPHNEWVRCSHKTCGSCGWNPAVAAERKEKQYEVICGNGRNGTEGLPAVPEGVEKTERG